MAIPKPITRVEQYLAHISGMRVNVPEAPLTREERYLAAWAKKSGIEDAEIQGDPPLTLKDCIGEPFKGLVLYGKSTQVTTTGAQLLDIPDYTGISRGVTVTVKEGLISLHGTCNETGWVLIERVTPVSLDGVYILSVYGASRRATLVTENYLSIIDTTSAGAVNNMIAKKLSFSAKKGEVLNVDGIKVMLNAGDTAFPWEPYTGGKPSPSLDYPQEIQSAKGEVVVSGKNLLNIKNSSNSDGGLKSVIDNGVITINGVTTSAGYIWNFCTFTCEVDGTYVLSTNNNIGSKDARLIFNVNNGSLLTAYPYAKIELKRDDVVKIFLRIDKENYSLNNVRVCPQLEYGSEATDYEPYRTPQTLTLSTPNGLPGIPVLSNGNYTDPTGQQWICDEVDLERGVYVQRIYTVDIAELEYSASTILQTVKRIFYKISMPSTGTTNKGYCTRLTYSANYTADNPHFYINEERIVVFIPLDTTIKPKEYLVQYVLATPIETQLSETDIAAYRALTTYRGTTILESECGLKVIYSKLRK